MCWRSNSAMRLSPCSARKVSLAGALGSSADRTYSPRARAAWIASTLVSRTVGLMMSALILGIDYFPG